MNISATQSAPSDLLPCPFCGHDKVAFHPNDIAFAGPEMWLPGTVCYAHCDGCGAEGPQSMESQQEAVDAWNRRTDPAREDMLAALNAAKRLTDNINEFGSCTDAEIYDAAWTAIEAAISKAVRS